MTTAWQNRTFAYPLVYPDNATLWQAASEERLLLKRCIDCGEVH